MTSILRTLQAEWNSLVPAAQARGIRRVRPLSGELLETIAHRRAKLEWLRAQIGTPGGFDSMTFGVELECILPDGYDRTRVAQMITAAGVDCRAENYNHENRTWWKVVQDGSLGNYRQGAEFVSPALRGEAGFLQLRKVCDVLTSIRAKVTKRCGLHVHIGARTMPISFFKNLIKLYASAEDDIDTFVAPSRRLDNAYFAQSLKTKINARALADATTVDQIALSIQQTPGLRNVRDHTRYCKLNVKPYWQHGTVEIRQHQGTVEAQKAENWVKFVLRMAMTAAAGEKTVTSFEDLMTAIDANDVEKTYFAGRVTYFSRLETRRA